MIVTEPRRKVEMPSDDLDTVGFAVGEAARMLRERFNAYARAKGITRSQWRALLALMRHEPVSQVKLADYLEVEPMSLCRMADRLQAAGMVERHPDPHDRRIRLLTLSPKARELLAEMRGHGGRILNLATYGFSERQKSELVESLMQMRQNLESSRLDDLLHEALARDDPNLKRRKTQPRQK